MAAVLTYTSLVDKLNTYFTANDARFTSNIPFAIMLAQQRLARDLEILGTQKTVNGTFAGDTLTTGVLAKPADWLEPITFIIGTGTGNNTTEHVFFRRYSYVREIYPNAVATGKPRFYSDYDYYFWKISPVPDQAYPFEIQYRALPVMLDEGNQENFFTRRVPDLLLYAALLEQSLFTQNSDKIKQCEALYQSRLQVVDKNAVRQTTDNQEIAREA